MDSPNILQPDLITHTHTHTHTLSLLLPDLIWHALSQHLAPGVVPCQGEKNWVLSPLAHNERGTLHFLMQVRTFTLPYSFVISSAERRKCFLPDFQPVQAIYASPDSNGSGQAFYLKLNWGAVLAVLEGYG